MQGKLGPVEVLCVKGIVGGAFEERVVGEMKVQGLPAHQRKFGKEPESQLCE